MEPFIAYSAIASAISFTGVESAPSIDAGIPEDSDDLMLQAQLDMMDEGCPNSHGLDTDNDD